jgi:formiminotetrahydrofolate cyclodeaminase
MAWQDTSVNRFAAALATPGPEPAAGAAAAATCAFAAALVELAEGREGEGARRAAELSATALELLDRDAAAARTRSSDPLLAIAEAAAEVATLARHAERRAPRTRRADAAAAAELARAACLASVALVEANLAGDDRHPQLTRARALASTTQAV